MTRFSRFSPNYFAKSGKTLPSTRTSRLGAPLVLAASFAQHYGTSGPTRMGQDRELFDELIDR